VRWKEPHAALKVLVAWLSSGSGCGKRRGTVGSPCYKRGTVERSETEDLRSAVARIAQYQPFGSGELHVEFSRRAFVQAAAHENGGHLNSLGECREVCDGLWGLELDIDEIRDVVERLVKDNRLAHKNGGYELTKSAADELADCVRDSAEVETEAFTEWELSVAALDPGLSHEQIAELRDDLDAWLERIVVKYGVEAALILYPEHERAGDLMESVESIGFDFLPTRENTVEEIRQEALYSFIHRASAAQRTYLANQFTTAYMVAIFTLDPSASEAIQALTKGQRAYLDTNVVYSILNLNGPRAYLSARRVLELTRELGYEVCVTPWTVEEMRQSVRRARDRLAKTLLPPRALAEIAAETSGDETFVTAYWRKYKETGVTAKDFLDLHEQVEGLLEKAGITIEQQGCTAVDQDADGLAEQVGRLEMVPGGANKSRHVKEHDAKHRMLVERLRGEGHRRFSNAGCWFITRDSVLIPYAAESKPSPDSLPFAVSLPSWAQIVRSLSPRTEDYERTLVDLLDTPSIRPRGIVSYETVAEVLGRIDFLVEDSSEEIATRMLLDGAVMQQVENQQNGDRQGFIDEAVTEKKAEMERQLRETQEQVTQERAARLAAEQKAAEEEAARRQEEAEREREQTEAAAAATQASESVAAAEARAKQARTDLAESARRDRDEIAALQSQIDAQGQRLNWLIAAFFVLAAAIVVGLPLIAGWITDGWPLVALIVAGGAFVFAAVAWVAGSKKATAALAVVGLVLGIVVGLHEIVSSDDPAPHPPSSGPSPSTR
jgi:hypothetical protein